MTTGIVIIILVVIVVLVALGVLWDSWRSGRAFCTPIPRPYIKQDSRDRYREIIRGLVANGAQGIILGCTEIGLLVGSDDSPIPVFDTTQIHAATAVEHALAQ